VPLSVNAGLRLNNASALGIAAYLGPPAAVEALLDLGADASHVCDHGSFVWTDACQNPQTTVATLELLKRRTGTHNINMRQLSLTNKWGVIDRIFEFRERFRLGDSEFVHGMANTRGSTPLHFAARIGRLDIVRWLLANGAAPSLKLRNARNRTPLLMAHNFGPHLAVEAELNRHELVARMSTCSSSAHHDRSISSTRAKQPTLTELADQRCVTSQPVVV
jgi:ankyrin repeat protein